MSTDPSTQKIADAVFKRGEFEFGLNSSLRRSIIGQNTAFVARLLRGELPRISEGIDLEKFRAGFSFQTGGSRVFTTPRLIEVAEHGAERITAEPLGGARRPRGGNTFIFSGLTLLDEIGAQKLGREIARINAREDRRTVLWMPAS